MRRNLYPALGTRHSKYCLEISDQGMCENFDKFEKEAGRALEEGLVHPTYDYDLKCSQPLTCLTRVVPYL